MRILIVDDDPVQRWLLHNSLTEEGYLVLEADNANAAWQIIQNDDVQLVITNWVMSDSDGIILIRKIRTTNLDRYVYIILLTGRDTKLDIVGGLESGADDYLTKPYDPRELLARVMISRRILQLEADLREARDHAQRLAQHDSLTGLLNRRSIYEHAEAELSRAIRDAQPLSVILFDIDHFKEVNDTYGHLVGDQTLYLIAATISRNKRPSDWLGRWGGEEFLLVLPNTSHKEVQIVAERLRQNVAELRLPLPNNTWFHRTISLGVATAKSGFHPPMDILIQQADTMLLEAKAQGRNRISFYTEDAVVLNNVHYAQ